MTLSHIAGYLEPCFHHHPAPPFPPIFPSAPWHIPSFGRTAGPTENLHRTSLEKRPGEIVECRGFEAEALREMPNGFLVGGFNPFEKY